MKGLMVEIIVILTVLTVALVGCCEYMKELEGQRGEKHE